MLRRVLAVTFAAAIALTFTACGRDPGPVWIHLASSTLADRAEAATPGPWETVDGRPITLAEDGSGTWLESPIPRAAWRPVGHMKHMLRAALPVEGQGIAPERLTGEGITGPSSSSEEAFFKEREQALEIGQYWAFRGELYLRWPDGTPPPATCTLRVPMRSEGTDPGGRHRVRGRRFSGEGLFVWPGQAVEREVVLEAPGVLQLATCVERLLVDEAQATTNTFRVLVDGEPRLEHAQPRGAWGTFVRHELPALPAGTHRIRFEVEGPLAYTSVQTPVIRPAEVGSYAQRPWPARPNLVVFLADTFRADNLALYGGDSELTPHLNAFAETSLRFRNAWSVGTYTLPAHATLFSGLFPRQTTASDLGDVLPDELLTVTELLRDAGYRTGAITDSAVVSAKFNLNQGFEWFDEFRYDLDSTVERAADFLAADDGRPVFLFVQTYRTHSPYRVEERPEDRVDGETAEETRSRSLARELKELAAMTSRTPQQEARMQEVRDVRERTYRLGAKGLDRGFASFLEVLERHGLRERGYLVFTSDHGEAFLEHGQLGHKGRVFEEQIRIPLLVTGPDVPAREVEAPASLVDLSPTLARMAGLTPPRDWLGSSLLTLATERPIYAFESTVTDADSTITVIEGGQKIIGNDGEQGFDRPWAAFDLAADPGERRNLVEDGERWPAELYERHRRAVDVLLEPVVRRQKASLDDRGLRDLEALGYVAEE